jgi:hypothetical protein
MSWLSETETRGLRKNGARPSLLPLREVFDGPSSDPKKIELWLAESELFVRWGLDAEKGKWRPHFWQWVQRSSAEEPSESLFRECFGIDSTQATALLERYLLSAVLKSAKWRLIDSLGPTPLGLRDATVGEIARIKGDWERLAANYVRINSPSFERPFVEQAQRTLHRAYDRGDRDPRLLAVLGLQECDADRAHDAREFLEAAARGQVVRPRAYLELARLRLEEQRAHPADPAGKLSAAQTADVLAPLLIARRQSPALPQVFGLVAQTWAISAVAPQREDLAVLDEGAKLFPQHAELVQLAAMFYFDRGFSADATRLCELGLRNAPNDAARERFVKLKAAIADHP